MQGADLRPAGGGQAWGPSRRICQHERWPQKVDITLETAFRTRLCCLAGPTLCSFGQTPWLPVASMCWRHSGKAGRAGSLPAWWRVLGVRPAAPHGRLPARQLQVGLAPAQEPLRAPPLGRLTQRGALGAPCTPRGHGLRALAFSQTLPGAWTWTLPGQACPAPDPPTLCPAGFAGALLGILVLSRHASKSHGLHILGDSFTRDIPRKDFM